MKIEETKNVLKSIIDRVDDIDSYFIGFISKSDFIAQMLFEIIKKHYCCELPTASLRQYANDSKKEYSGFDAEYEQVKRNHKMALKEQEKFQQSIGMVLPKRDMGGIDVRLEGYKYNPLQMQQIQNYKNLEIITALSNGRMPNSKKISRTRFKEIYYEYDNFVYTRRNEAELSPDKRIFNAIDFYDIQIRMKIELTYNLTLIMEKYGVCDYPAQRASFFVSGAHGEGISLQNRFLLHQNKWFPYVFGDRQAEYEGAKNLLVTLLFLKKDVMDIFYSQINVCDFDIGEVTEFIQKVYNPFSVFTENKDWSNSRIDLARKVLNPYWIESK